MPLLSECGHAGPKKLTLTHFLAASLRQIVERFQEAKHPDRGLMSECIST